MLVEAVEVILLISPDARGLKSFYVSVFELPLEDEVHEGVPLHYACRIGTTDFAIHPAEGWPGERTKDAQSPIIGLKTSNMSLLVERLRAVGISVSPADHGFADVISFRDPDGNHIEVLQAKEAT